MLLFISNFAQMQYMKIIPLTKGMETLVDDEDFERFGHLKWHFTTAGYAARRPWCPINKKAKGSVYLHREICQTPKGLHTDHVNGVRLDNRKENLRVCNPSQNQGNEKLSKNNTTGYRGVIFSFGKYRAQIKVNYKTRVVGAYDTAQQAYEKYKEMAVKAWGEFARV